MPGFDVFMLSSSQTNSFSGKMFEIDLLTKDEISG
jgi:hypothetical protein